MYKPGNLSASPAVVTPHQPRLDWQMWFAALGDQTQAPWFTSLMYRLLQGKTDGTPPRSAKPYCSNRFLPPFALNDESTQNQMGGGKTTRSQDRL